SRSDRARPARPTLFPYTTLFRSDRKAKDRPGPRRGPYDADRGVLKKSRIACGAVCQSREQPVGGILRCCCLDKRCKVRRNDRGIDRKSTRLNSSHVKISYAVFCL